MRVTDSNSPKTIWSSEILNESTYDRLHRRAEVALGRESAGHRLEPTDLVHETFLRIARSKTRIEFQDGEHLLAVATIVMRHILIDDSRSASSPSRYRCVPLEFEPRLFARSTDDEADLQDVLRRLATCDARLYRIVELRFFGGLKLEEVATALSVSSRTVKRRWTIVRGWLRRELS